MQSAVILDDKSTWPPELSDFLKENREEIYEKVCHNRLHDLVWDSIYTRLNKVMKSYFLKAYHCTRLTDREISFIKNEGMKLQNLDSLVGRVDELLKENLVTENVAERLQTKNQSNHEHRAKKLWFCFLKPKEAGENGIERFLRFWGGEALYGNHEHDAETGQILKKLELHVLSRRIFRFFSLMIGGFQMRFHTFFLMTKSTQDL